MGIQGVDTTLGRRERELVNLGASVATGCRPCVDYHFARLRELGVSDEAAQAAMRDALVVRDSARAIMERHGLRHIGFTADPAVQVARDPTTRLSALVGIAAAFAVNCTENLQAQVAAAQALGVPEPDIQATLDAAQFIKSEAAHYVGEIVRLERRADELEHLLEQLKRTQAKLVQSEKMAALGKLIAGVMHELNTPLGALTSASDTTQRALRHVVAQLEGFPDSEALRASRAFRASINALETCGATTGSAARRIHDVICNLKRFVCLDESGSRQLDVRECLDSARTMLASELDTRISVVEEYADVPRVLGYRADLNQVFFNLLTHAVQSIEGEGIVTLQAYACGDDVVVRIADDGVGVAPGDMDELFDPHFGEQSGRVDAGLGLFVSKRIIENHGGRIELESALGAGSTFTIVLPVGGPGNDSRGAEDGCGRMNGPSPEERCARLERRG